MADEVQSDELTALDTFASQTSTVLAAEYNTQMGGAILPAILALIGPILTAVLSQILGSCPTPPAPASVQTMVNRKGFLFRLLLGQRIVQAKANHPAVALNTAAAYNATLNVCGTATLDNCSNMLALAALTK